MAFKRSRVQISYPPLGLRQAGSILIAPALALKTANEKRKKTGFAPGFFTQSNLISPDLPLYNREPPERAAALGAKVEQSDAPARDLDNLHLNSGELVIDRGYTA